jgi:hypothetical protein
MSVATRTRLFVLCSLVLFLGVTMTPFRGGPPQRARPSPADPHDEALDHRRPSAG